MWNWIEANSTVLSVVFSGAYALIWLVYLQVLVGGVLRTRRPLILISRTAGTGHEARLYISNMGAEPIYITSLIADLDCGGTRAEVILTDNTTIADSEGTDGRNGTNEGPLASGAYLDAGGFGGLMDRIDARTPRDISAGTVDRMTLTVVAATGHSARIAGGRRSFRVLRRDDAVIYHPETTRTRQLYGRWQSHRLRRRLDSHLRAEAQAA